MSSSKESMSGSLSPVVWAFNASVVRLSQACLGAWAVASGLVGGGGGGDDGGGGRGGDGGIGGMSIISSAAGGVSSEGGFVKMAVSSGGEGECDGGDGNGNGGGGGDGDGGIGGMSIISSAAGGVSSEGGFVKMA